MNIRRKLVIALGAGALAAPFGSFAQQQGKVWRVGYLGQNVRPASLESGGAGAFFRALRDLGYVEGKNLVIEWRFAEDKVERLPRLAAELVQLKVDVIMTGGTPAVSAAQKATTTIPIVFGNAGDPVGSGFVKSLARPGGNITGLSNVAVDISSKLLEMLLSMAPKVSHVAVLVNPTNSSHVTVLKNVQTAAQRAGVKVLPVNARTQQEIENGFYLMIRENATAAIIPGDSLFNIRRPQIAALAAKNRLPSISLNSEYAEAGGLMSYGPAPLEQYRRAATYVDKIFKGAKPGELPVERPSTFELAINRKTAAALGLTIPQSLLISADKVIE